MRMRTTARLDCGDLFRTAYVRDVEDPHPTEPVFACRRGRRLPFRDWNALLAAVEPAVRHLNGHEHQVLVYRHITLPARANDRSKQTRFFRVRDVVDIHPVKIAHEKPVTLKCKVR